jgi:hypothetical protein
MCYYWCVKCVIELFLCITGIVSKLIPVGPFWGLLGSNAEDPIGMKSSRHAVIWKKYETPKIKK